MNPLKDLLEKNRQWASDRQKEDPLYFQRLCSQQAPKYLWIGCSDSRVPANQITGLQPGEVFVHRNVANIVVHTDFNALSVIQYAVEVLKVEHIIVCGHYGCGGVSAALQNRQRGLIDNWLRNIKDIASKHHHELEALEETARINRLCELNVSQQVANLCHTTIIQGAWARGTPLTVHGLIYGLTDGQLKDLGISVNETEQLPKIYRMDY
jgi:carbonic anhydrase